MIQILLHSSKTMRVPADPVRPLGTAQLLPQAEKLARLYQKASLKELMKLMSISEGKAKQVQALYRDWSAAPDKQTPAIDTFVGDIYSGLQVQSWSDADRRYAHQHLVILSGLYGALRAGDGVMPYRLEMGYKLPDGSSLYACWGDAIARSLPDETTHIMNLSAVEYTKAVLPHLSLPVITPRFLTMNAKQEPVFVTVHAKIARGAFASWLIRNRITSVSDLSHFTELGYQYDASLSTPKQPVFVCQEFQGLGLSVRLTK